MRAAVRWFLGEYVNYCRINSHHPEARMPRRWSERNRKEMRHDA